MSEESENDNLPSLEFDFSMEDILFKGKPLTEWEEVFTITVPNIHMTNQEMQKIIISLNNKYHLSYNCYNELLISYSKLQQDFEIKKGIAVRALVTTLRSDGAGRIPGKDVLDNMAIASNIQLKNVHQQMMVIDIIKTFFENNKIKLEKSMQLVINLSYMISSSDRVHYKSGDPVI
jgi:hypothetical protein